MKRIKNELKMNWKWIKNELKMNWKWKWIQMNKIKEKSNHKEFLFLFLFLWQWWLMFHCQMILNLNCVKYHPSWCWTRSWEGKMIFFFFFFFFWSNLILIFISLSLFFPYSFFLSSFLEINSQIQDISVEEIALQSS